MAIKYRNMFYFMGKGDTPKAQSETRKTVERLASLILGKCQGLILLSYMGMFTVRPKHLHDGAESAKGFIPIGVGCAESMAGLFAILTPPWRLRCLKTA